MTTHPIAPLKAVFKQSMPHQVSLLTSAHQIVLCCFFPFLLKSDTDLYATKNKSWGQFFHCSCKNKFNNTYILLWLNLHRELTFTNFKLLTICCEPQWLYSKPSSSHTLSFCSNPHMLERNCFWTCLISKSSFYTLYVIKIFIKHCQAICLI